MLVAASDIRTQKLSLTLHISKKVGTAELEAKTA